MCSRYLFDEVCWRLGARWTLSQALQFIDPTKSRGIGEQSTHVEYDPSKLTKVFARNDFFSSDTEETLADSETDTPKCTNRNTEKIL